MPYKDPAVRKRKHAEYSAQHYKDNKESRQEKIYARKRELKEEWSAFKRTLKCTNCGFDHPAALDFHHTDPTQKDNLVSKLVSNGCYKKARAEILKCIILCANCHRIHHHEEKKNPAF